jgi:hypothetical protein
MTITIHDTPITGVANVLRDAWCVYEHYTLTPGEPPQLIYMATCPLIDIYRMREARDNSEWSAVTNNGTIPIMCRIVATTDDMNEARDFAIRHIKSFPNMPRCNLHGYNMHKSARRLMCSNGKEYATQSDAARDLGVNQSAISQHLQGRLRSVKGFTFTYKVAQ